MVVGLKRYSQMGHLHVVTFSCYRRRLHLGGEGTRDLFESALERIRCRYDFRVVGYVVMPEHVHLLISEPDIESLSVSIQALKLSVARRSEQRPFWQARFYDFSVFTEGKRAEKLNYMHWNPVRRGLVESPEHWKWSSYRRYCAEAGGAVTVDTTWNMHWKAPQGN
jgi:putative transposase